MNGEPVAGLGMTGMSVRRSAERTSTLEQEVIECGAAVAADIGYTGDNYKTWIERMKE